VEAKSCDNSNHFLRMTARANTLAAAIASVGDTMVIPQITG